MNYMETLATFSRFFLQRSMEPNIRKKNPRCRLKQFFPVLFSPRVHQLSDHKDDNTATSTLSTKTKHLKKNTRRSAHRHNSTELGGHWNNKKKMKQQWANNSKTALNRVSTTSTRTMSKHLSRRKSSHQRVVRWVAEMSGNGDGHLGPSGTVGWYFRRYLCHFSLFSISINFLPSRFEILANVQEKKAGKDRTREK